MASSTRTGYRHADHAGNFADLFKHTLLIQLLGDLRADGVPLVYLESHAGAGRYHRASMMTWHLEVLAADGSTGCPAACMRLKSEIHALDDPPSYPGSPWLAARLLGPCDRLGLVERAAGPLHGLERLFDADARVACRSGDGFRAVLDLLPASTQPGLLLVDPPYAEATECTAVLDLLADARSRWPSGTLAAWYPRRDDDIASHLLEGLRARSNEHRIDCWIDRPTITAHGMRGCGVVLINPPRDFARDWKAVGDWLAARLFAEGAGRSGVTALD